MREGICKPRASPHTHSNGPTLNHKHSKRVPNNKAEA